MLLDWSETGFNTTKQYYVNEPSNPDRMYTYFWALESHLPLAATGLEWRPSIYDLKERLGNKFENEADLRRAIERNPGFQENLKLGAQMQSHLQTADDILERLKPFDAGTYSYLQAVYSTNRNRAYVYGGLLFDFSKAEEAYRAAFAVPDQYLEFVPDNDQVRIESISLRQQLVLLLEQREEILEGSSRDKICTLLRESFQLAFADGIDLMPKQIAANDLERLSTQLESRNCGS